MEEVGRVDLAGSHPRLCFMEGAADFPDIYADPLVVLATADWVADVIAGWRRQAGADEVCELLISYDDVGKAGLAADYQVDDFYTIAVPNGNADAPLKGERHRGTLVEHLRLSFRWGGFPGWERYDPRPEQELAYLTADLLPI
jgi:hypothetical protein